MPKVSVIIPVYNTENYLRQCLDSVIGQTFDDMEIICVNDGSTDSRPQILEEYAARDNRIRVIHKQNGGLVSARKTGIKMASGQYIGYVDSDDWIEPEMYETLYLSASSSKADLVSCGHFLEGAYTTIHMDTVEEGFYSGERMGFLRDHTIYRLDKKEAGIRASLCYKLFTRELITKGQHAVPNDLTMAEDKMCLLTCILECSSVLILKRAFYHYRINAQSMVHASDTDYLLRVNAVYQYLLKLYQHPRFTENMRIQSELYVTDLLLKGINTMLGFRERNLLWFDPYWLDTIPSGSKVVLYGAGEAGRKCQKQLLSRTDLHFVGCVDFGYQHILDEILNVESPDALKEENYDYIVITIKNSDKAVQIRTQLEDIGIASNKILWFEQKELFWRYAEAEGLLKETGKSI